jgi:hypothetical protein
LIEIEFEEVVEPKRLLPFDSLRLVEKYGSHIKAAEAFVHQNCLKKGSS